MPSNPIQLFAIQALALTLLAASQSVETQSASVKFQATTNVSAISIHGQSSGLRIRALLSRDNDQLILESLDATLDPKSLSTGMSIRDSHMRDKIFNNSGLAFHSPRAVCPAPAVGKDAACQLTGLFTMRGIEKPFAITVRLKAEGARYKVSADGGIKISDYGVEPPCQLGVCVTDSVKLHIEATAEERVTSSKSEAVRR